MNALYALVKRYFEKRVLGGLGIAMFSMKARGRMLNLGLQHRVLVNSKGNH